MAKTVLTRAALAVLAAALTLSAPAQKLVQIWTAPPGSITPLGTDTSTRTIDFNPVSGNLLFENRTGSNGVIG